MARFAEVYDKWCRGQVTQGQAASQMGVSERTFRRHVFRFRAGGLKGLEDGRMGGISHRRAPPEETVALEALYAEEYPEWRVRHFHKQYQIKHGGQRSYTWVKDRLQEAGLVERGRRKVPDRERWSRKPAEGMMVHQNGVIHEWVPGRMWDLIISMDDATSEVYSGFLTEGEGTWSSFRGVRETLVAKGLFNSLCTDRESHYWRTPKAGAEVDGENPTQFGRAMKELGIEMIPSYSPQVRGLIGRLFGTLQRCLPQELAQEGITEIAGANAFLRRYWPKFNGLFAVEPKNTAGKFVPLGPQYIAELDDILCLKETRKVDLGNCVSYRGKALQIPPQPQRDNYVRAVVRVHEYEDGCFAVFHGRLKLGRYDGNGRSCQRPHFWPSKTVHLGGAHAEEAARPERGLRLDGSTVMVFETGRRDHGTRPPRGRLARHVMNESPRCTSTVIT